MKNDNPFRNNQPVNPIYLIALLGGFLYWLIIGIWTGKKIIKVLEDQNKYKNSLFFIIIIGILVSIFFYSNYIR